MWTRLLAAFAALLIAMPAVAAETPDVRAPTAGFESFVERQAHRVERQIAQELPAFAVPALGYGVPRADAMSDGRYQQTRDLFRTARILGVGGYAVAAVGALIFALAFVTAWGGGGGVGTGGGIILGGLMLFGGAVAVLVGGIMGQVAWLNEVQVAKMRSPPGPSTGLGYASLGMFIGSFVISAIPGLSSISGLVFIGSYVCAELQNSATHRYWMASGARRNGLPKLQLKVKANGIVGRF